MPNQDFFREASAVAFGGRIIDLEDSTSIESRIRTNLNLFAPGLSCGLAATGGRSRSLVDKTTEFELNGVNLASLGRCDVETYDRELGESLSIYSRARVENLRLGIDKRLHIELAEAELLAKRGTGDELAFELRRATAGGLEFAGSPITVTFGKDLVAESFDKLSERHDAEQKDCPSVKRFKRKKDDYVEFNVVDKLEGPNKAPGEFNKLILPNFGAVEFGIVQAGEYFRRFILARFTFGSPYEGGADAVSIIDGGRG